MKKYVKPELNLIELETTDCVLLSTSGGEADKNLEVLGREEEDFTSGPWDTAW